MKEDMIWRIWQLPSMQAYKKKVSTFFISLAHSDPTGGRRRPG